MSKRIYDPTKYVLTGEEPSDDVGYQTFLDQLTDIPESAPLNTIEIDEAGIIHQAVYVYIDDLTEPDIKVPVLCDVTASVDLKNHRGIHMSRCEEALFKLAGGNYSDLDEFAVAVAECIREKQSSHLGMVKITGTHLQKRTTKKSSQTTMDKVILLSEAVASSDVSIQRTGVSAFNMTACPCTRTYSKFSVVPRLRELGFDTHQIQQILDTVLTGTHTQRGTVTVMMDKKHPDISAKEILRVIDTTTHLVHELLKRPDEHDLVIRALQKPQFTEDVVRDVAMGIFNRFGETVPPDTSIDIESVLYDSIHIHDVRTAVRTTIGKIKVALHSK